MLLLLLIRGISASRDCETMMRNGSMLKRKNVAKNSDMFSGISWDVEEAEEDPEVSNKQKLP